MIKNFFRSRILFLISILALLLSLATVLLYFNLDADSYCRGSDIVPYGIDCGDSFSGLFINIFNAPLFAYEVLLSIQTESLMSYGGSLLIVIHGIAAILSLIGLWLVCLKFYRIIRGK